MYRGATDSSRRGFVFGYFGTHPAPRVRGGRRDFGEKLIEAKAHVALRMLTSSLFNRVTTAEIGRRAGFLSASHFARVIRARTGRTPLHLRRETNFPALGLRIP
jgi:AraC-like DNA-binding protein